MVKWHCLSVGSHDASSCFYFRVWVVVVMVVSLVPLFVRVVVVMLEKERYWIRLLKVSFFCFCSTKYYMMPTLFWVLLSWLCSYGIIIIIKTIKLQFLFKLKRGYYIKMWHSFCQYANIPFGVGCSACGITAAEGIYALGHSCVRVTEDKCWQTRTKCWQNQKYANLLPRSSWLALNLKRQQFNT